MTLMKHFIPGFTTPAGRIMLAGLAIWLLLTNPEAFPELDITYLEVKPEKGEGIYQLLRRYGHKANRLSYQAFVSLNNRKLKDGDSLYPGVSYKLPVISVSLREPLDSLLEKLGVSRYRKSIIDYNRRYNPGFRAVDVKNIPAGTRILIPELGSGFYIGENGDTRTAVTEEPGEIKNELSVPYPGIKSRIRKGAYSRKLENYCFILDAGHGGNDPGTNPFVLRGDGREAHAFEAPLVYDTTLRLMKHIMLHGGEVYLTHYSTRYGIREVKNPRSFRHHRYNLSSKDICTDNPAESIAERKRITAAIIRKNLNRGKKTVFLSIHADYLPNKTRDLPITFFYHRLTRLDGGKSMRFARQLSKAVTGTEKNCKAKGLGVLYKNPADLEVLIELANLNNKNGAWRLRYHTYREKLAKILCDGLMEALR